MSVSVEDNWTNEEHDWHLKNSNEVVHLHNTNDKFEVELNVRGFRLNEIEANVSGYEVLINCRHESREDEHGVIKREIHRKYCLPIDVDPDTVKIHLSPNGILKITAQKEPE